MARFPEGEAEIAALALRIISGIESAGEEFGSPPVSADELRARLDTYNAAKDAITSAETAAKARYGVKEDALEQLEDGMKADLRFAEIVYRHDPEKLGQFGWGPRREDSSLEVPGQARSLEVIGEGHDWVVLDWKPPLDGGAVAAYKIMRRRRQEGAWEEVRTAVDTQVLIRDQERGIDLEYHVVAVNKSGEGKPSNIVSAVL